MHLRSGRRRWWRRRRGRSPLLCRADPSCFRFAECNVSSKPARVGGARPATGDCIEERHHGLQRGRLGDEGKVRARALDMLGPSEGKDSVRGGGWEGARGKMIVSVRMNVRMDVIMSVSMGMRKEGRWTTRGAGEAKPWARKGSVRRKHDAHLQIATRYTWHRHSMPAGMPPRTLRRPLAASSSAAPSTC